MHSGDMCIKNNQPDRLASIFMRKRPQKALRSRLSDISNRSVRILLSKYRKAAGRQFQLPL